MPSYILFIRGGLIVLLVVQLSACARKAPSEATILPLKTDTSFRMASVAVGDSFTVRVALPEGYDPRQKYPTIYLLDGDLYFDLLSASLRSYARIGIDKQAILVGVGYGSLARMDSLRSRDFTYPTAIPEYEMSLSGGALRFVRFLQGELLPVIEHHYSSDSTQRTLFGHSLGGYLTLLALAEHLEGRGGFSRYIAASPSVDYNHGYILNRFRHLKSASGDSATFYMSFGGQEETEEEDEPVTVRPSQAIAFFDSLAKTEKRPIRYKSSMFSELGHMDTPYPSFTKGLRAQ